MDLINDRTDLGLNSMGLLLRSLEALVSSNRDEKIHCHRLTSSWHG
jgi:hypothetical protein